MANEETISRLYSNVGKKEKREGLIENRVRERHYDAINSSKNILRERGYNNTNKIRIKLDIKIYKISLACSDRSPRGSSGSAHFKT